MDTFGHDGLQLFAQFYTQVIGCITGFLKISLYCVICHVVLVDDGCPVGKSLCRLLLCLAHLVHVLSQCGESLAHSGSRQREVAQHGGYTFQSTHPFGGSGKLQQGFVGICLHQLGKLLHIQSGSLGQFLRLAEHLLDDFRQGGRTFLAVHHCLIKHRGVTHYLSLCQSCLMPHACQTVGKIDYITFVGTGCLPQGVHDTTCREHGLLPSLYLVVAEKLHNFADVLHGILSKVFAQCHVYHVSALDELHHGFFGGHAQASGIACQFVELFAGSAGVQSLEFLVQFFHRLLAQSRVFDGLTLCFLHFGKGIHGFHCCSLDAGQRLYARIDGGGDTHPFVTPIGKLV